MGLECEGENGRYFHVSYRGYIHIWNLASENGFTQEKILTRQELRKVFRMDPELYDEYGVLPMGSEDATIMADTLEHALKNPLTEHPEMLRDFIEFSILIDSFGFFKLVNLFGVSFLTRIPSK